MKEASYPLGLVMAVFLSTIARGQEGGDRMSTRSALEHGKISTADATPVGRHAMEIELSYGPTWTRSGFGGFERTGPSQTHPVELAFTYGIRDDLDLTITMGYGTAYDAHYRHDPGDSIAGPTHGDGHTDDAVSLRWRFLQEGAAALDLALVSGFVVPTGARASVDSVGLSRECWSWDSALVLSMDLGRWTGNLELGVSLLIPFEGEAYEGATLTNVAFGYHVLDWLQPELEVNYQHTFKQGSDPAEDHLALTAGLVAPFGDGYRLTAGVLQSAWGHHTIATTTAVLAFKVAL